MALIHLDLSPAHRGAHVLRHSLATGLWRNGASLAQIGQVLRHQLPQTTEIYAKVDFGALRPLLKDYLKLRRRLGYKLQEAEFLLRNFVRFIEQEGTGVITAKLAVRWAARPDIKPAQSGSRLSVARRFAAYVSAHDARTEVPAQKLLPYHLCRRDPYHYTDGDVQRLIDAARQIDPSGQIKGPTLATLAVTGMRVGEALALDCRDVDLKRALLTIRLAKGNKSRILFVMRLMTRETHFDEIVPEPCETSTVPPNNRRADYCYPAEWSGFRLAKLFV